VCGCDGVTYSNDCERINARVQKAHNGACDEKQRCGGFAGWLCDEGQYCDMPEDTCGFADMIGECVTLPEACPEIWDPVCGCDGVTYSNDCDRIRSRVPKAHDGACE
ncbi:MAG: Kazal-type serine protease inhibitor family protein, partial [Planctomycetota bacterium]|nr:Kazal-type serine protease inhibitor family protein [Planctomycetota bacterium]